MKCKGQKNYFVILKLDAMKVKKGAVLPIGLSAISSDAKCFGFFIRKNWYCRTFRAVHAQMHGRFISAAFFPTLEYVAERRKIAKKPENIWEMIHRGGYPEMQDKEKRMECVLCCLHEDLYGEGCLGVGGSTGLKHFQVTSDCHCCRDR